MNRLDPKSVTPWASSIRKLGAAALAFAIGCGVTATALAAPAQLPLLSRAPSSVQPNVMFTFDDSGSMSWRFMPDGAFPVSNAIRFTATWHVGDTNTFGNGTDGYVRVFPTRASATGCTTAGGITSCPATDLVSARLRSPAWNTVYYNPEIRYLPWVKTDGTYFPNATPTAAFTDAAAQTGAVDLTVLSGTAATPPRNTIWCRSETSNTTTTPSAAAATAQGVTCNTLGTFQINQAVCQSTGVGGTWNTANSYCALPASSQRNCTSNFGVSWDSGSRTCYIFAGTEIPEPLCLRIPGVWNENACATVTTAVKETYAPATYYQMTGTDMNNAASFRRVRIMEQPTSATIVRGANRKDCAASGCTRAQEMQNFANWFTYYRTRNYLSIAASSRAFAAQTGALRVGYGRINKGSSTIDGTDTPTVERGVRAFTAASADRLAFFNWLYTVPASGGTPLRRAVDDIGKYYMRADNRGPWGNTPGTDDGAAADSLLQCRKSYQILMTDGFWNGDGAGAGAKDNNDGTSSTTAITGPSGQSFTYVASAPYTDSYSDTLADIAMYYWKNDLLPNLPNRVPPDASNPAFWQHLVNFTVGLGVDGTLDYPGDLAALQAGTKSWPQPGADKIENVDDLWHAAVNSRGTFLSAKDPDQFAAALTDILSEIVVRNGNDGGVAAAASTLQAGNRKYVPEYRTGVWSGNLTAYGLDAFGQQLNAVWNAKGVLPAAASRNIFAGTRNGTTNKAVAFNWTALGTTMQGELGTGANTALVDYLRGDRTLEGTTYRERDGVLGDFVNSQPVFVKGLVDLQYNGLPATVGGLATGKGAYRTFVTAKKARTGMVFIGGNDGMLHGFSDTDGVEKFAFIPRILLPKLSALSSTSYGHSYYVDGQLTETDVYNGTGWKNLLIGSNGAGERGIFGIDVTSTTTMGASNVLWELDRLDATHGNALGYVLAPIEVGLMKDGTWAAVFGNGTDSTTGTGQLFVVNALTGAVIRKIQVSSATGNGLGGARLVRDANQVVVGAYAGDIQGKVWKFDLSATNSASWGVSFSGTPLYDAGTSKPIVAAPQIVAHPQGGYVVLVGTGKLFEEGDQSSTTQQAIYGLWDKQQVVVTAGNSVWRTTEGATTLTPVSASDTLAARAFSTTTVAGAGGATYYTITANALDWSRDRGWVLPLNVISGQRSLLSAQFLFGFALFETMSPSDTGPVNPCESGASGVSFNILIDPVTGKQPAKPIFDVDGDGVVTTGRDTIVAGVKGGWDGRDVVLTQRACVNPADCPIPTGVPQRCGAGTKLVSIQGASSGANNVCVPVPPPSRWWWRNLQQIP